MAQVRRKIDNIAHRRSKRHKAHKVYGTPLEVLTVLTRSEIPEIVRDLVRFIEKGCEIDTIFIEDTKPQYQAQILDLKKKIENVKQGSIVLLIPSAFVAVGALKAYLLELPDSLLSHTLYADYMEAIELPNVDEGYLTIQHLIGSLPRCNQMLIGYLLAFFDRVLCVNHAVTSRSIATVWGSLFLRPSREKAITNKEIENTVKLLQLLIDRFSWHLPDAPTRLIKRVVKRRVVRNVPVKSNNANRSPASAGAATAATTSTAVATAAAAATSSNASTKATAASTSAAAPRKAASSSKKNDGSGDEEDLPPPMPGGMLELARQEERVRRCSNYPVTDLLPGATVLSVRALYAFDARKESELTLARGDIIEVTYQDDGPGWWEGYLHGKKGLFPSNYCEVYELQLFSSRRKMTINTKVVKPAILLLQQSLLEHTSYDWDNDQHKLSDTISSQVKATEDRISSQVKAESEAEAATTSEAAAPTAAAAASGSSTSEPTTAAAAVSSSTLASPSTEASGSEQPQMQQIVEEIEEIEMVENESGVSNLVAFEDFSQLKSSLAPKASNKKASDIVGNYQQTVLQATKFFTADSQRLDAELPVFDDEQDDEPDDMDEKTRRNLRCRSVALGAVPDSIAALSSAPPSSGTTGQQQHKKAHRGLADMFKERAGLFGGRSKAPGGKDAAAAAAKHPLSSHADGDAKAAAALSAAEAASNSAPADEQPATETPAAVGEASPAADAASAVSVEQPQIATSPRNKLARSASAEVVSPRGETAAPATSSSASDLTGTSEAQPAGETAASSTEAAAAPGKTSGEAPAADATPSHADEPLVELKAGIYGHIEKLRRQLEADRQAATQSTQATHKMYDDIGRLMAEVASKLVSHKKAMEAEISRFERTARGEC